MRIMIYAIGGALNNTFVGCAHDSTTGQSLLRLIELSGGYACSVHGNGLLELDAVSGECALRHAAAMFTLAEKANTAVSI